MLPQESSYLELCTLTYHCPGTRSFHLKSTLLKNSCPGPLQKVVGVSSEASQHFNLYLEVATNGECPQTADPTASPGTAPEATSPARGPKGNKATPKTAAAVNLFNKDMC